MNRQRTTGCSLALGLVLAAYAHADTAPSWLHDAAGRSIPSYDARVPAVVLLQEARVSVADSGQVLTTFRRAVKILTPAGRSEATGYQLYVAGTSKPPDFDGWVIAPSGRVLKLGVADKFDRVHLANTGSTEVYSETRDRGINGYSKTDPGAVFGYESITEERSLFSQFDWLFQDRLPTLVSRYVLSIPTGSSIQDVVSNAPGLSPNIQGSTYTWELRDLPFVETEPWSPPLLSLLPRLAVNCVVPPGAAPGRILGFANWKEVSRWLADLSEAQSEPTTEISAKVHEATVAAKTELVKINSIASLVRQVRDVVDPTGMGRGDSHRPRSPDETFQKLYGDSKDKSALFRAMLKAVGIRSYLVSVHLGDRNYVRKEFPSPLQFDHTIVAIQVTDETSGDAVVNDATLGRLLLCDPRFSPGYLPADLQASLGLVNAGDNGVLLRLPVSDSSANRSGSNIEAMLSETGDMAATAQNGRPWQHSYGHTGQLQNNRLLIFKIPPPVFGGQQRPILTASTRKYPVLLNPTTYRETLRVKLPASFVADELPDPVKLEAPFGSYSGSCTIVNGDLVITRNLDINMGTIPVAQYVSVREFFQRLVTFEQTPVVLMRRQ